MKIIYFVPDFDDPATPRRIAMLRAGGMSSIVLIGFSRRGQVVEPVDGVSVINLGSFHDGHFTKRIAAMSAKLIRMDQWRTICADATVIMARNLDMLALASVAKWRLARGVPLVYECLDVHWLSHAPTIGYGFRSLERRLVKSCSLLVVSSLDYVTEHFAPLLGADLPPVYLAENKVLSWETAAASAPFPKPARAGPPWRIGWYGKLVCRNSLHILAKLAKQHPDRVEIVIRGFPNLELVPDFHDVIKSTAGMTYHGPYDRSTDLPGIYSNVHFTWSIGFHKHNLRSTWALTNRLYEGSAHGSVVIAQRATALDRWLMKRGIGLILDEPIESSLDAFFGALDQEIYETRFAAIIAQTPISTFVASTTDCEQLVSALSERPMALRSTGDTPELDANELVGR